MFSDPKTNLSQCHVDPAMTVVDLGSGDGSYSLELSTLVGPSGKVYAIDIQKDLLQRLSREAKSRGVANIETIWSDIDEPNGSTLRESFADRVLIANTLFQVEDKDQLITESFKILKPNGRLVLIDWEDSYGGLGPQSSDVIKPDVAQTLVESQGFVLDRKFNAGAHHYGLIFKKR